MLKKILKYDLIWCFKPLLVFYILTFFFAVIVRIVESFKPSIIILIIDKICCGILIAMIINILINCFMRNWVRFIRNIYKDESYLTHTLPVSKNKIYLAKILTQIITLITSFIVIITCLFIAILNKDTWIFLKDLLEQSAIYFNSSVFSFIFVIVITIFFEFLFIIMCGTLGIIIGHKSNNLKIVKSIIISFLLYIISSSISLGLLFLIGLINKDVMSLFTNQIVTTNALKNMMLIGILVYFIYILVIYFISNKLLNQGVNVD